jgi:hypothetical protein
VIAAIDNTFLTVLLNPNAAPRPNPQTGQPIAHCRQRIEALIDDLSRKRATLLVPAPALAEALCATEAIEAYFKSLQEYAAIELAPFDGLAAYEFGRIIRKAKANGDKRSGQVGDWQNVKMDRTIVAIALSRSATILYSDDGAQRNFAIAAGLAVKSTWELDLPDEYAQHDLSEVAGELWPAQKKPTKSCDSDQPPAP